MTAIADSNGNATASLESNHVFCRAFFEPALN